MCTAAPGVPGPAQLWWFPREGPRTWPVLFSVAQPRLGSAGSSEDLPALRSHPLPQVTPSPKSPPPPSHPLSWSPPPLGHALLQVTRSPGSPPPPSHPLSWVTPSPGSRPPPSHPLPQAMPFPKSPPPPAMQRDHMQVSSRHAEAPRLWGAGPWAPLPGTSPHSRPPGGKWA